MYTQCARFQSLFNFDGEHRSCRASLENHNRRRRQAKGRSRGKSRAGRVAKSAVRSMFSENEVISLDYDPNEPSQTDQSTPSYGDTQSADDAYLSLMKADGGMDIDEYSPEYKDMQLSIKFHEGTPSDLPESLYDDLLLEVPAVVDVMGAIRPGCTHLTTSLRVPAEVHAEFMSSGKPYDVTKRLHNKWSGLKSLNKGFEVQIEQNATKVTSDGSHVMDRHTLPPLLSLIPCCVSTAKDACLVDILGYGINDSKFIAMCRQNGRYLTSTMLMDDRWNDSEFRNVSRGHTSDDEASHGSSLGSYLESRGSSSICVTDGFDKYDQSDVGSDTSDVTEERNHTEKRSIKIIGLEDGVCEIEFVHENNSTPPLALLILPDADAVEDIQNKITSHQHKPWAQAFLRDVGFVIRNLYGEVPCPSAKMSLVRRTAETLISYSWKNELFSLASFLESTITKYAFPEDTDLVSHKSQKNIISVRDVSYSRGLEYVKLADAKVLLETIIKLTQITQRPIDSGWKGLERQIIYGSGMLVIAALVYAANI